jgi:hypothetical protein
MMVVIELGCLKVANVLEHAAESILLLVQSSHLVNFIIFADFELIFKKKLVNPYLLTSKGLLVRKKYYVRQIQHQEMRDFVNPSGFVISLVDCCVSYFR